MRYGIVLLLSICLGIILAGCQGSHEPDQQAYVIGIGFDIGTEPGTYKISYQLATPGAGGKIAGGDSGGGGKGKTYSVITIDNTFHPTSRNLLKSMISLTPTLSHAKLIVFGEELSRQGLGDILGVLKRLREYRGSMIVAVTTGTAKEFLNANSPLFATTTAKYYEVMIESENESGYYLVSFLHNAYTNLKSEGADSYMMLVGVNPTDMKGHESGTPPAQSQIKEYKAGELLREGGNPLDFAGTALFRGERMVGTLTTQQTRMLNILLGRFKVGFLQIKDPLLPDKNLDVELRGGGPLKFETNIIDGQPKIEVNVFMEAEIATIPSGINYEKGEYGTLLESEISQVIEESLTTTIQYMQQVNSDAAGFGNYFRSKFRTYDDYQQFHWLEKFSTADIKVNVKTTVRRGGLQWQSSPITNH